MGKGAEGEEITCFDNFLAGAEEVFLSAPFAREGQRDGFDKIEKSGRNRHNGRLRWHYRDLICQVRFQR
jgi:hypothetical protein